jgi:hypothetical protein
MSDDLQRDQVPISQRGVDQIRELLQAGISLNSARVTGGRNGTALRWKHTIAGGSRRPATQQSAGPGASPARRPQPYTTIMNVLVTSRVSIFWQPPRQHLLFWNWESGTIYFLRVGPCHLLKGAGSSQRPILIIHGKRLSHNIFLPTPRQQPQQVNAGGPPARILTDDPPSTDASESGYYLRSHDPSISSSSPDTGALTSACGADVVSSVR